MINSEEHEAIGTNYSVVEPGITCMLTRFRLRSVVALVRFLVHYRRIKKQAEKVDGLITSAFLIENLTTCYTLSIWKQAHQSIPEFNVLVTDHIHAANASFDDLVVQSGKPLLWSAQFRLSAISPHNFRWEGTDFSDLKLANQSYGCTAKFTGDQHGN